MTTHPDHQIAAVAARQRGAFSRNQVRAIGLSDATISRRVASGSWRRVLPSVYLLDGFPSSPERVLWIGLLSVEGAVVSRTSAAELHGFSGVPRSAPSITVLHGHRPNPIPGLQIHETRRLHRIDQTIVDTMPATAPARTIIDLAAELGYARLAHVIDQADQSGAVSRVDVLAALRSITRRGRKGCRNLRQYFDHRMGTATKPVSELEYRFDQLLTKADLPPAKQQFRPPWYDGIRGVVDRCWPSSKLIVELDGRSFHSTMQAWTDDRRRDRLAQRHGYSVLRFSYEEVTRREEEVIDDLLVFLPRPVQLAADPSQM